MRELKQYMDSTYLKTADQAKISESENLQKTKDLIQEAIDFDFKLAMILPQYVAQARVMIDLAQAKVAVGTVIDFPLGSGGVDLKIKQATQAIADGVDELDYVVDYQGFKKGEVDKVKQEVELCTKLGLEHGKVVKWIIETAALNDDQIVGLTALIKNVVMDNFNESQYAQVFVKSSTGFYETSEGLPNGATYHSILLMLENAGPLPVKASGGIRDRESAIKMISLGVKRLGTSSAKVIVTGRGEVNNY